MQKAIPALEEKRLAALAAYDIVDTPPEEAFDRLTRMTTRIFGISMATITFVDGHRQWFKSRRGVESCETARGPAFCNITIAQDQPLIVPDTHLDERFKNNPFVIGSPHLRFYAGAQLRTAGGVVIGTLCAMDNKPHSFNAEQIEMLVDLAAVAMNELELRMLATRDDLTGALSRQAFREEGARAVALAKRHKHELSCTVFDLDHFKKINDEYGHDVGDMVLEACISACRQESRESDIIGRIGGEEFAILMPHTSREAAMVVAEKLRQAIARIFVQSPAGQVRFSASFGVAALDNGAQDIDDLLKRADIALYDAKGAGRNRCMAWKSPPNVGLGALRRVFKAGRISFNTGNSTIDCTVRGLSDTAASLDVISTAGIPERFKLQITADDFFRSCTVSTKRPQNIEVRFV